MADYLDVLVLCSDPVNLRRTLNLTQELIHFEHIIRRSQLPIRMRRDFPPTREQLQREFARADLDHRWRIRSHRDSLLRQRMTLALCAVRSLTSDPWIREPAAYGLEQ